MNAAPKAAVATSTAALRCIGAATVAHDMNELVIGGKLAVSGCWLSFASRKLHAARLRRGKLSQHFLHDAFARHLTSTESEKRSV
jgi:hypothetical protein